MRKQKRTYKPRSFLVLCCLTRLLSFEDIIGFDVSVMFRLFDRGRLMCTRAHHKQS